jgi:hypothetical protein
MKIKKMKWIPFLDYEKEEAWLNEMSSKGYAFTGMTFGGRYIFDECSPGEYAYRKELLEKRPGDPDSKEYLRFMADNGAECVFLYYRHAYFRRKAKEGRFDIYSSIDSRLQYYRRVKRFFLPFTCIFFILAAYGVVTNLVIFGSPHPSLINIIALIFGTIFFVQWNKIRKKIKQLEQEKRLRE